MDNIKAPTLTSYAYL